MRLGRVLSIAFAAMGLAHASAFAADCDGVFKFLRGDRIEIQELRRLTPPEGMVGPDNTVLIAQMANWEDTAFWNDWQLWGVVYGGFQNGGEAVVGGSLWVSDREAFGPSGGGEFRRTADGLFFTVRPASPLKGCKTGFTFKLDPEGRLFADGRLAGVAR